MRCRGRTERFISCMQHPVLIPSTHPSFFSEGGSGPLWGEWGVGEQENQPQHLVLRSPRSHTPPPSLLPTAPWGEPSSCHLLEGPVDPNLGIQKGPHLSERYRSTELDAKVGARDCFGIAPCASVELGPRGLETGRQPIHSALALSNLTFYLSFLFSRRLLWCSAEHVGWRVPGSH